MPLLWSFPWMQKVSGINSCSLILIEPLLLSYFLSLTLISMLCSHLIHGMEILSGRPCLHITFSAWAICHISNYFRLCFCHVQYKLTSCLLFKEFWFYLRHLYIWNSKYDTCMQLLSKNIGHFFFFLFCKVGRFEFEIYHLHPLSNHLIHLYSKEILVLNLVNAIYILQLPLPSNCPNYNYLARLACFSFDLNCRETN